MTKKEWDPFSEADKNLNKYSYFFDLKELEKSSDEHPQVLEDFMDENCPQNYCYAWLWEGFHESKIVSMLVGVPKNIALAVKLTHGIDLVDTSGYGIEKRFYNNNFVMYLKE
ncbi:hypothetical protein LCGC14_0694850 [marine sediment metagenome]|uniref:Uncharacterized protein n=1 Tax=marine sediment metagenome TaxID=412755 RepID=A0A0F9QJM8_9ZZZZ